MRYFVRSFRRVAIDKASCTALPTPGLPGGLTSVSCECPVCVVIGRGGTRQQVTKALVQ